MSKLQFVAFVIFVVAVWVMAYFVSGPIFARDVDYLMEYWGKR